MPAAPSTTRPWAAIAAVTVLTLPLGSIYAFSIFLRPIENELGIPRSALSFVFALATIGFTIGMNAGPAIYRLAPPAVLIMANAILAALGIVLAAKAQGFTMLLVGYGIVFGVSGGTIFILLQQAVNLLVRSRIGLLNGYVLGLYPIGAMLAAPLFGWGILTFGYRVTLLGLAAALAGLGAVTAVLTIVAGSALPGRAQNAWRQGTDRRTGVLLLLCLVFFLAAAAGLTVLSQAAGIIAAYGGTAAQAVWATTAITAVIASGRIAGGWLVDRFPVPFVSASAHALSLTGAILLSVRPNVWVAILSLAMIGGGYGLVSGSTAGAVASYWPKPMYGRVAGRVYIAWCVAAVTLPVLSGHLFDLTGGYRIAFLIAAAGNLVGLLAAPRLPRLGLAIAARTL